MSTATKGRIRIQPPTAEDAKLAKALSRQLAPYIGKSPVKVNVQGKPQEEMVIPDSVIRVLVQILAEMARGNAVSVIPENAELTTQQAADFLNVSRPFVVKLMDEDKLHHHKVGKHRRVLFTDLMEYKKTSDRIQQEALADLAAEAQELNMGY